MRQQGFRLKHGRGFFAAGEEFGRALRQLGDGAFKLFAWVCLRAQRSSGRLSFERREVAWELGKSRRTVGRHLAELVRTGVCELENAPNQHRRTQLRVCPEYWPYVRTGVAGAAAPGNPGDKPAVRRTERPEAEAAYVAEVREAFLRPCCVRSSFGAADERLAIRWHQAGVPLPDVRRAILLGSTRKSMAMVNRNSSDPVASLRYFEQCLPEVQQSDWPEDYWRHLEDHLLKFEECLGLRAGRKPGRARPELAQPVTGAGSPAPATAGERKEKTR